MVTRRVAVGRRSRSPVPLVQRGRADRSVDTALLLVDAQPLGHVASPLQNLPRAVEENSLFSHRNDETSLGCARGFDVFGGRSNRGIATALVDHFRVIADLSDSSNLLTVKRRLAIGAK